MEDFRRELDAPFNMAVATLMRLDTILQQIRMIYMMPLQPSQKQKMHIDLVKQFYLNSTPLIDDDNFIKENNDKILNLKMKSQTHVKAGNQKTAENYSSELEVQLNKIIIELQRKLSKFFMPKGKDPGRAIEF